MAVAALTKLCGTTIEITESKYENLVSEREQLRILKNYTKAETTKDEIIKLINAMDASDE